MEYFTVSSKNPRPGAAVLSILLLLLCLFLFSQGISRMNQAKRSEQKQMLSDALSKSITQCYALEGSYPANLYYIEEHYGLTYDKDAYRIDYQYIGANILPDVTILER